MLKTIISIIIVIIINYCAYLLGHSLDNDSTNIIHDFMMGWGMLLTLTGFLAFIVLLFFWIRNLFD